MSNELSPSTGSALFPSLAKGGEPRLTGERGEFSGAITTRIRLLIPKWDTTASRHFCGVAFSNIPAFHITDG